MAISNEWLAQHLARFDQCLKQYPERYTSILFADPSVTVPHVAYLCPLCLQTGVVCTESYGSGYLDQFSKDHYPPKSVGGTTQLLVCKVCNDKAGHSFDNVLKDLLAEWGFSKRVPSAVLPMRSRIEGLGPKTFKGYFQIDDNGEILVDFKPKPNDPIRPVDEWIKEVNQGKNWQVEAILQTANEQQVDQALVKTAYLFCFQYWGYDFAFSQTGERMREVIRGERKYPVRTDKIRIDKETVVQAPQGIPLGLCRVLSGDVVPTYVVTIRLTDSNSGYQVLVGVPVPGPADEHWDQLPGIMDSIASAGTFQIVHVRDAGLDDGIIDGYTGSRVMPG